MDQKFSERGVIFQTLVDSINVGLAVRLQNWHQQSSTCSAVLINAIDFAGCYFRQQNKNQDFWEEKSTIAATATTTTTTKITTETTTKTTTPTLFSEHH